MAPVKWPDGQSSITDPEAVYVVALFDMTDGSNMLTTPAWCKETAIPHMWDRDIEAVLGTDRLAELRARCGAILCDGALRCLTCEEVGVVDAMHQYIDNHLYERILKQRIPGLRAFGDGVVFTVPGASPELPATDEDVTRMVYSVYWAIGNLDAWESSEGTLRVLAVPSGLVEVVEAIVRSNTPHMRAAWDALDPAVRESIQPGSFIHKKIERLGVL